MDPEACVAAILSDLSDLDNEGVFEKIDALRGWIARGGFRPHGWTPAACAAFLTACANTAHTLGCRR